MNCSGPCLPHCYKCSWKTLYLSRIAISYMIACIFYILATRNYGTPFMDSLTYEQREIKKQSAKQRYRVFMIGMMVGSIASLKVEFKPT